MRSPASLARRLVRRDPLRGQRGLTLVELMISMVISMVLLGFVLSAHTRFSTAFRSQSRLADLEQTVFSAQNTILEEVRQAGFSIPNGFRTVSSASVDQPPIEVVNNADGSGPDLIRFYYADASASARVLTFDTAARQSATVDFVDDFAVGDVVVLVNPSFTIPVGGGAAIANFQACVVEITSLSSSAPAVVGFTNTGLYNSASNPHCIEVANDTASEGAASETMLYRFVARSYRIDPARKDVGVLQLSPSGELLANDWVDLGVGVVDLQIASRYAEEADVNDVDGDGNAARDWYSGEAQETPDSTGARPLGAILTNLSISVSLRTSGSSSSVPTAVTPAFIDPGLPLFNRLGDAPAVQLEGVADADRPEQYRGDHQYRYTTTMVDMRNLGVGQ